MHFISALLEQRSRVLDLCRKYQRPVCTYWVFKINISYKYGYL